MASRGRAEISYPGNEILRPLCHLQLCDRDRKGGSFRPGCLLRSPEWLRRLHGNGQLPRQVRAGSKERAGAATGLSFATCRAPLLNTGSVRSRALGSPQNEIACTRIEILIIKEMRSVALDPCCPGRKGAFSSPLEVAVASQPSPPTLVLCFPLCRNRRKAAEGQQE